MTNWKTMIEEEMIKNNDSWDNRVDEKASYEYLPSYFVKTLNPNNEKWYNVKFNNISAGSEGHSFVLWTKTHIYFPVVYDGREWVGSVPRDPKYADNIKLEHFGGE